MGIALLRIKIMPESLDVNLEEIQKQAEKTILENQGQNPKFEKQPIAFGLTALIVNFSIDESNKIDFEIKLSEIENISSVETIDFRRAFG